MTFIRVRVLAITCIWLAAASLAGAQQAPAGGPTSSGAPAAPAPKGAFALTTAGRVVANLDKTLQFYRDVFGLVPYGAVPPRPLMNQALEKLGNTPGARFRQATVRLPNSGLLMRLMEVSNVQQTRKAPQAITDAGEAHFRFEVSDIEAVVANLQRVGAQFVAPATPQAARAASSILVRDLDGYLLEVVKGFGSQGSNIGAGASPVLDSRVVLTVSAAEPALKLYRDILGASVPETTTWQRSPFGAGEVRSALSGDIGGPGRVVEIREYRNVGNRAAFQPRLQDSGATLLSFMVRDLPDVVKQVQAANMRVVTPEARPVASASLDRLMIQDPDGVFVEIIQE